MSLHLRHIHLRKRHTAKLEPYPARSFWKRVLDRVVLGVGIAGPIMSIPQIVLIYVGQDATGVSPISWVAWATFNIPWILYGIAHRELPIIVTYTLWFICNSLIFIGALLYS